MSEEDRDGWVGITRFDKLADAVTDMLALVDEEGRLLWSNPASEQLFGMPPATMAGRPVFDLVHPDDREYAQLGFSVIRKQRPVLAPQIRVRVMTANQGWRLMDLAATNRLDDPDLRGIVISGRDVTDQWHGGTSADFDADRLRTLVDATSDFLVLVGRDELIAFANLAVRQLIGYEPQELLGKPWYALVHPDDLPSLEEAAVLLRSTPTANITLEARLVAKNGVSRLFELKAANRREDPNLEGTIITGRDLTELRSTQRRLRDALDHSDVGFAELRPDGTIRSVNDALVRLTGTSDDALVGSTFLDHFEVEDRPPIADALAELADLAIASGDERAAAAIAGRWAVGANVTRWISGRLSANRDTDGALESITCFLTDITELKAHELQLHELSEELARYATHDALTDAPNRFLFHDHLVRALDRSERTHAKVAVLFCDLDWFKEVNDTLGHHGGDVVLQVAADRLMANVRPADTVARMGGDEFAVLAEDLESTNDVIALAQRLVEAMTEPIDVDGRVARIGVSIGIAVTDGGVGEEALLREADRAVFEAKAKGRGRYSFAPGTSMHGAGVSGAMRPLPGSRFSE